MNTGTCLVVSVGRKKRQTSTNLGYVCQCLGLYTGSRCETLLSLCSPNPCVNNGTCFQDVFSATIRCICPPNFTGTFCTVPINGSNVCTVNPGICGNGGTCRVNGLSTLGFSCVCPPTWTGVFCEQPLDSCRPNGITVCVNNGTCVSADLERIFVEHRLIMCRSPPRLVFHASVPPDSPVLLVQPRSIRAVLSHASAMAPVSSPVFKPFSASVRPVSWERAAKFPMSHAISILVKIPGKTLIHSPHAFIPHLGVNGGVCRSTAAGGVVCTCPTGFTGVRW